MRIGFDAKRLFNNFTGLGNYSRFVVSALAAQFPENEYWLYTPKLKRNQETEPFLHSGRLIVRLPDTRVGSLVPAWWRSVALGNVSSIEGADIFHGLSNELPLSKPARLRTVVTVHDLIFKRFPNYYHPIDVQLYTWKLKKACASADLIIAISQQTAADLKEYLKIDSRKLRVVYQGCHSNFEKVVAMEAQSSVRAKYQLPDQFILFVGTLERRKNAALLLKAISLCKEQIPVVLVGKPTDYMKELRALVATEKLESRVHFLHHVSFADLPAVYQSATLFVYPSFFEGFGIPIVEAIVSGVPVITSRGSCFEEAGGPATTYINPANPEELAAEISRLLADEHLRADIIKRSMDYVTRFRPPVIAAHLMKVYGELV